MASPQDPSDDLDFGATLRGFAPGQTVLKRYELERLLGRGGMGVVWLAMDNQLEREVALKFLPEVLANDPEALADLKRETRRNLDLTHPNIVRIYDFVSDANSAAISMEYVAGQSLSALRLEKEGRAFSPDDLWPWVREALDALDYAHRRAMVVHRDLKPANLMVDAEGHLKVLDFGIAASISTSVSRISNRGTSGTLAYMSPQQLLGKDAAPSDDWYSFGATLYDLLCGRPPFYTGDLTTQIREVVPASVNERRKSAGLSPVPVAWETAVAALLAKEPGERPLSGAAVLALLEGKVLGPPLAAAPSSIADESTEHQTKDSPLCSKPKKHLWFIIAAVAVLTLGGLGYYLSKVVPGQLRVTAEEDHLRLVPEKAEVLRQSLPVPAQRQISGRLLSNGAVRNGAVSVELVSEQASIQPGRPFWVALKMNHDARWHSYWINAGVGWPTSLEWTLPEGFSAGPIVWPTPQLMKDASGQFTGIGFQGEVFLFTQIAPPASIFPGRIVTLRAKAEWLMCKDVCVPGKADLELALPITTQTVMQDSPIATTLHEAFAQLPKPSSGWHVTGTRNSRILTLKIVPELGQLHRPHNLHFFDLDGLLDFASPQPVREEYGIYEIDLTMSAEANPGLSHLTGVLSSENGWGGAQGYGGIIIDVAWETTSQAEQVGSGSTKNGVNYTIVAGDSMSRIAKKTGGIISEIIAANSEIDKNRLKVGQVLFVPLAKGGTDRSQEEPNTLASNGSSPEKYSLSLPAMQAKVGPVIGEKWTIPDLNLTMVPIAPGTFTMGSNDDFDYKVNPEHEVTLTKGFWLGATEVTVSQFKAFASATKYLTEAELDGGITIKTESGWGKRLGTSWKNPLLSQTDEHPVVGVSWNDANAFCLWMTQIERQAGRLPEGYKYTLPTEAQWEYACRAGTTGAYAGSLDAMGWFDANSNRTTHSVGQKQANAWGLFDMHGNVREWCLDWYGNLRSVPQVDPTGAVVGPERVSRDGSWNLTAQYCSSAFRTGFVSSHRLNFLGFRLALAPVR